MEQLEEIKENDEFLVRVRIEGSDELGIWFRIVLPNGQSDIAHDYVTPWLNVFTNKVAPLHRDACRTFKIGDMVRVVVWNGRTCLRDGQVGIVVSNEDVSGMVELSIGGWSKGVFIHACKLELISTLEEREPYYVVQNTSENSFDICRMYYGVPAVRQSFFYTEGKHEGEESVCNAELTEIEAKKEATEACERLNVAYSQKTIDGQDNTH